MKKILLIALLFIVAMSANAQRFQKVNTWGWFIDRFRVDSLFVIPRDTITPPVFYQNFPFLADKGGVLYKWNISTHIWESISAAPGGSTISNIGNGYNIGVSGTNNIKRFRDSLYFKLDSSVSGTVRGYLDVDGLFSNLTATNAITKTSNNFKLGGELTNNTAIGGSSLYALDLNNLASFYVEATTINNTSLSVIPAYFKTETFSITGDSSSAITVNRNGFININSVTTGGVRSDINMWPDSISFFSTNGNYKFRQLASTIDTTTYKPFVIDINGNLRRGNSWTQFAGTTGGVTAHSALTGLTTGDDHTQYAFLAGRVGGQTLRGGTAARDTLYLLSTSHGSKGMIVTDKILVRTDTTAAFTSYENVGATGTVKVDVGMLGNGEANLAYNMRYDDPWGVHKSYDGSKNSLWIFMQTNGWGMQYADNWTGGGDVWDSTGNKILFIQENTGEAAFNITSIERAANDLDAQLTLKRSSLQSLAGWDDLLITGHRFYGTPGDILLNGGTGNDGDIYLGNGVGVTAGSQAANGDLNMRGTTHATKTSSYVILQQDGGSVGIGTATPSALLTLNTTAGSNPSFHINDADAVLPDYSSVAPLPGTTSVFTAGPLSSTVGGALIRGFTEVNNTGTPMFIAGVHGGTSPTTAANVIAGLKHDGGTDYTSVAATELILQIRNGLSTNLITVLGSGFTGINTTDPDGVLETNLGTTGSFRLSYNDANGSASNRLDVTLSSVGSPTYNATGTNPEHTFSDPVNVPDDAYAAGWDGNTEVATKNALYDKIETIAAGGEVNTASNLGGGLANYSTKVGVDLQFNSFLASHFNLVSNLIELDTATLWPLLRATIPAGGGSGTVTSVDLAYGITGSNDPITTTGTVLVDSTKFFDKTASNVISGATTFGGLTASRALFLDAAKLLTTTAASASLLNSLSDETGTGVAVFGTAPTLTTSLTVSSAGQAFITNNSATGSNAFFAGSINGTIKSYFGTAGATNAFLTSAGVLTNDLVLRTETANLVIGTNAGTGNVIFIQTGNGNVGIGVGTTAPAAKLHIIKTTEQRRTGYDASNYLSETISSIGSWTGDLIGTSPIFTFSDNVVLPLIKITGGSPGADKILRSDADGDGTWVSSYSLSKPRIGGTTSDAAPTPNVDAEDVYIITALAVNATFGAPTGTPVQAQLLRIRITDNGTIRTLAWNAAYETSVDFALPTATVVGQDMRVDFEWNNEAAKWQCTGLTQN